MGTKVQITIEARALGIYRNALTENLAGNDVVIGGCTVMGIISLSSNVAVIVSYIIIVDSDALWRR